MTLPPIDAVRYYEWIGRDIEGKENILVWLGDVQQIYRSHAAYNRLVVELARQLEIFAWWTCVHLFWRMATIVRIYVWTASIQTRRDMC